MKGNDFLNGTPNPETIYKTMFFCQSQPLDKDGSQALEVQKIIRPMKKELGLEPFGDLKPYTSEPCSFGCGLSLFTARLPGCWCRCFSFSFVLCFSAFISESGTVFAYLYKSVNFSYLYIYIVSTYLFINFIYLFVIICADICQLELYSYSVEKIYSG